MSVHYKFKSALKYDTITFDGLHISVKDLKRDILQQKQIGKTGDFDLQITNAQTNEVYQDDLALIPKNSSLVVVRVPLTAQQKRAWDRQEANQQFAGLKHINTNLPAFPEGQDPAAQKLAKTVDLSSLDASEDDKIMAMMTQSTLEYDPINYARIRTSQVGEVPPNYRCYKCHQAGHWIKDCRFGINQENQPEIRKSTGIPRSFMVPVDGPSVPGAMMTPSGQFAVPSIDQQAYLAGKTPSVAPEEMAEKPSIPEELVCSICHDLLTDTVMIPCCGSSFCDECIRTVLLESENHQCPDCKEIGISPDTMIPNRYLRKSVDNFRNTTGYQRSLPARSLPPTGPDMSRGLPPPQLQMPPDVGRMPYQQPDRSATPTVDERSITSSLPDTSVPPPAPAYAITSLAGNPSYSGLPPGYGGPPPAAFPRAPLPYPNLGPGPGPNYPPVDSRNSMRPGYRPFIRGSRHSSSGRQHGGMHSGYRHDRGERNNTSQGGIFEDPLTAFEKILREKDLARERHRRRKRSFSRSPSPAPRRSRTRSRTRSRSRSREPLLHRKRGSLTPPARPRSPSPSPRPRSRLSRSRSPPPRKQRSRTRSPSPRPRSRTPRSRSRSPLPPVKRRSPSFTISRSRSRSFSRTPSPRDRHFSPRRREDSRFRSPLQGRNSPQRFHSRSYEGGPGYYEGRPRGRQRGYGVARGRGRDTDPPPHYSHYSHSPARFDSRYDERASAARGRYGSVGGGGGGSGSGGGGGSGSNARRYESYADPVPPGTEPAAYERYEPRDRDREVREAAARDWERTRDRELEQRERERQREYEEYQRGSSGGGSSYHERERRHERGKENKHSHSHSHERGETIEAIGAEYRDKHGAVTLGGSRVSVLVDLKKEPSTERDRDKERKKDDEPPKEKKEKKDKEKKKKRKEDGEKKEKKKKRKEKKEEKLPLKTIEGKPIVIALKETPAAVDPLYGDIEGTSVDKKVVESYGKVEGEGSTAAPHGEVKPEKEKENVVLAPVPELSKWELDEEPASQEDRASADDGNNSADKKIVTSEVLKRAENAIFQKAINAIRPIDIGKKPTVNEKVPEKEKPKEKKDVKDSSPKEQPNQDPVKVAPETTTDSREARKVANSIQITIPSNQMKAPERSVELAVNPVSVESEPPKGRTRLDRSKIASVPVVPSSPVRVSAKERLGAKVQSDDRDEVRRVRSTVERKSRSKTPKRIFDRKYSDREKREISPGGRRVVVSSSWNRDKEREERKRVERRSTDRRDKEKERKRERSPSRDRKHRKESKPEKIIIRKTEDNKNEERKVTVKVEQKKVVVEKKQRKNPRLSSDRKKSALDEASFEPDYDESDPESEPEVPGEEKSLLVTLNQPSPTKKRSRSVSQEKDKKKHKTEVNDGKALEKTQKEIEKVKKPELQLQEDSSESDSSSDTSSDSSLDRKKRKKKKSKKRKKKKSKKRKDSSSESDSSESSSSDSDAGKKKKKHKHRKKSSKTKKRKKSKHK